jgi:hypothetical protein
VPLFQILPVPEITPEKDPAPEDMTSIVVFKLICPAPLSD